MGVNKNLKKFKESRGYREDPLCVSYRSCLQVETCIVKTKGLDNKYKEVVEVAFDSVGQVKSRFSYLIGQGALSHI
jgi:hypothetical protein